MLLADNELLHHRRILGAWFDVSQAFAQLLNVFATKRTLAPAPAGGLTIKGNPVSLENSNRVDRVDQSMPGTWHACIAKNRFHDGLVTKVIGCLRPHTRDSQLVANLAQGNLNLFQHSHDPIDSAELLADQLDPTQQFGGTDIIDRIMGSQTVADFGRKLETGSQLTSPTCASGTLVAASIKRVRRVHKKGGDKNNFFHS